MSARRRRSRGRGKGKTATLNLVSLMDIFTILVFFLMVNSSEVEVLQTSSDIKLPDSTSEQRPENQ
ncbi:MAG: biopolymer transport protein ExbD, partial [Candidatus Azotimanducaceae bacterium]